LNSATPWQRIVTDDGSSTLQHPTHQETYHSTFGARTESVSVFLQNSAVFERLQAGIATRVLEIGFGTGLNFMVTADAADRARCSLEYVAIEIDPIADDLFSDLLSSNFPNSQSLVKKSLDAVRACTRLAETPGVLSVDLDDHSAQATTLTDSVSFRLIVGDALTSDFGKRRFDAVYLDAFSPKNNPALWTASFLKKVRQVVNEEARLVSYCVSRQFKDALTEADFQWQKVKGPPGKREVLIATPT